MNDVNMTMINMYMTAAVFAMVLEFWRFENLIVVDWI